MVNLRRRGVEKQCSHTPTKRSHEVEIIHIESDSEGHNEEAGHNEEEEDAKEEEKQQQDEEDLCLFTRPRSFLSPRRFTVLSSEEEDNVPLHKKVYNANIKTYAQVRRRLLSSPSTSLQVASSTIETDSDNKPIAQRLLFLRADEFSTATSPPATTNTQNYTIRARRRASQAGSDDVHDQATESSNPLPVTSAPNMCREIVPLGIDSRDDVQREMASPDIKSTKRVKDILRLFNSYYLRFVQDEESRCWKEATEKAKKKERSSSEERRLSRRPDLKAITQMRLDKKLDEKGKSLGPVPGINVGDQFFSRCEMVAIGLHCHWLGGIDTIPASRRKLHIARLPVASSIVLSGNYEDDIDNSDDVIYTGSGGNDLLGNKRQIADQVLKRGNLALKNNMEQDIPVRLVRGHKTKKSYTGKVYTYDGLYKVKAYWAERGISGFTVYKFRLKRVEGQPILTTNQVQFVSGHVAPTNITELKGLVCKDISNGLESNPIPATNVVNPPFAPNDFKYTAKIEVRKGVRKPIPAQGCDCEGECFDPYKCSCAIRNNNRFPYVTQNGGRLVEPMDVVYECGPKCGCNQRCSNRVTQKGMQYRLEVFRTVNKGWGVRSWDTIPAGAPVCQYSGVLMRTEDADDICDNEFIFELDCLQTIKGIGGRQRRLISNGNNIGLDEGAFMNVPEQPEYCVDAGSCGSVSRLFNHSCEPNLFVQCVLNDHHDLSRPRIWFFAAETIRPLQELSYDYGYALDSVVKNGKVKVLPCYCGALGCRKRLH